MKAKDSLKTAFHKQFRSGYNSGYKDAVHFTIEHYSAILLICLRDKFEFTPEQLQEVSLHINNQFDSINKGYLSFEDVLNTLNDEIGVNVTFNGVVHLKEGDASDE